LTWKKLAWSRNLDKNPLISAMFLANLVRYQRS
jgi:hypothetical protein